MTDDVKTKIKKIFIAIGTGIASIGTFIFGILLYNHGKSDGRAEGIQDRISDSLDGISESTEQLRRNNEQLRDTNRKLDETNGRFAATNQRFGDLLEEIEKTKHND